MLKQILALLLVMVLVLVGAFMFPSAASTANVNTTGIEEYSLQNAVYINFDGNTISAPGGSAKYAVIGATLTIAAGGVYVLSGSSETANIVVLDNVTDNVVIVLNGLDISNSTTAPMVFGKNTNVTLTAAADTANTISDTDREQEKPYGAVNSEGSIVITGEGTITVNGNNKHAVKAGKTITVSGSTLVINSVSDGIHSGEDSYILRGSLVISADDDGIHSDANLYIGEENADNSILNIDIQKSYEGLEGIEIYIYSGNISVFSGDDGMNAAVGGSGDDGMPNGGPGGDFGGFGRGRSEYGSADADTDGDFARGPGRGFNSDGQMPDMSQMPQMPIDGQAPDMSQMPQMPTDGQAPDMSQMPQMPTGDKAQNDQNSDGENDGGRAFGGGGGGMMMDSNEDDNIFIYGGNIYVNAGGDGIDSNGYLYIYDGTVIVNQYGGGNAPLDSGLGTVFYGGTILATGSADMVETPDQSDDSVPYVHFTTSASMTAGTVISIRDSSGNTLITSTVQASGQCVIFSSPDVKEGETYTLIVNGSESGTAQGVMEEESGLNFGSGGGMFGGRGGMGGGRGGFDRPTPDAENVSLS